MASLKPGELKGAYDRYVSGVGAVAHAWNQLVETLGEVFVDVTKMEQSTAKAIWYSIDSDRTQINMLKAALDATPESRWLPRLPDALADLKWLADRSFNLADPRNNAIHAPCIVRTHDSAATVVSNPYSGHNRARKLVDVPLEDEFAFITDRANRLSHWTDIALLGLRHESCTWPSRPVLPERTHQKTPPK